MNKIISNLIILVLILAIIPVVNAQQCDISAQPSYNLTSIDGDRSEWMEADIFAPMYEAGKDDHLHLADLYLRYDCNQIKLYALVWAVNGTIDTTKGPEDHYIKIGQSTVYVNSSSDDSEFQFINNNGTDADGWEARIVLPDGCYSNVTADGLNVHTQVDYDGKSRTARPSHNPFEIDLNIDCREIPIPEFPTVALPIAAILGIMFILQSRRRKED